MRQRLRAIPATIPATILVAAVAPAMLLVACAGDDGGGPPAVARPTALPDLVDDPAATTAVSEALAALRAGNSGTFTTHLVYDETTYDYSGSYRLAPPQQRVSVTADLADGPVGTEAVGDRGRFYVRLPSDEPVSSPCWVSGDPRRVEEVTGVATNPDFDRLPGAISLASTAVGAAFVEGVDDVVGSVDLATATALVSPRLPALLGIAGGTDRVLARFALDDGVLSRIRVEGPALLAALATAGSDADPDELADVFGADVPIEVTLSDSGAEVVIEPPPPTAVIDLGRPDAQQRLDSCA
jgi:hypothetical protein